MAAQETQDQSAPAADERRLARLAGDVSGAFADLGTFLPLVVGVLAVTHFSPVSVLFGFGCFALATALIYRRPVPVQPMKVVAAVIIATGLSAGTAAASGVMIGALLVALAVTGAIEKLNRAVPQSVLAGVQLGIGAHLALVGLQHVSGDMAVGIAALAALVILLATPARAFACLAVLAGAVAWGLTGGSAADLDFTPGLHLPALLLPSWAGFVEAAKTVVVPQLMLTIANAVLATAALAAAYFPQENGRISPRRLALSSGGLNLLLAPLGALPMCHGAGGLVVQHKFGARTGLAPAIFGIACLALGLLLGNNALAVLGLLPLAAVGALLAVAGAEMAVNKRLFDSRPSCLAVILVTAAACLLVNVAVGVVAGFVAEAIRSRVVRRLQGGALRQAGR